MKIYSSNDGDDDDFKTFSKKANKWLNLVFFLGIMLLFAGFIIEIVYDPLKHIFR